MSIDPAYINAEPTKDFFITMLVRDIPLIKSIADLVDNSIDGALNLRGEGKLDGYWVNIRINENNFEIVDNCGGFSSNIARNYAFRFGRPFDAPEIPHSIGRFGVGMKRSLFKLGTRFKIASACTESRFLIDVDVNEWKINDKWSFSFTELDENPQNGEYGTHIIVNNLHLVVSEQFRLPSFVDSLRKELQVANEKMIERGLSITINGMALTFNPSTMLLSDNLKPAFLEINYNDVKIKLFAGLSLPSPKEAGWYVYCNGRLVLEADKSSITGWGDGNPNYHNTYARFRGYVFFDSNNSIMLPWNTTKSGIDQDSNLFRAIRLEMIKLMRPVIDFLKTKDNKDSDDETFEQIMRDTPVKSLSDLNTFSLTNKFQVNIPVKKNKPNTQKIQYDKPVDQINKIKAMLKVSTLREVGERTFDYFYEAECDD